MTDRIYRRRLPHIHLEGHVVFVTFRQSARQPDSLGDAERDEVLAHIRRMAPGTCLAFVVMPDHVHLVYQPGMGETLATSLQALKGASSHTLTKKHGRHAPVWQEESYDHVVRDERELFETCRYVEGNPVRKGLVAAAEQYQWSSAWGRER